MRERSMKAVQLAEAKGMVGETSRDCHPPNEPLVLDKGRIKVEGLL